MSAPNKAYSRSMVPVYTSANDANMLFRYSGKQRNGKYLDASGNGNDSASVESVTDGLFGVGFASPRSTITSPITTTTVPVNSDYTMSALFRGTNVAGANYGALFGINFSAGSIFRYGGCDFTSANAIRFIWYNGSIYRAVSASLNNRCIHLATSQIDTANNQGLLYINGNYVGNLVGIDVQIPVTPQNFIIGIGTGYAAALVTALDGFVGDGTLWNRVLSATDIRKEWLQYAQMAQFKTGWGAKESVANESTSGNYIGQGSTPFEIISGTWKVTVKTLDGELHKVLECVSAGTCWLDRKFMNINSAEASYGSWRGLIYHASNANPTILAITASAIGTPAAVNGYALRFYNEEARVSRYTAGVYSDIATLPSPGAATAMAEFQVQRRYDNNFRFSGRLAPGAYGPVWTDWQTSSYASDGTYTASDGMSLTANAGDYLSLGTVRDNFAFTKYLGEFAPTEV